MGYIVLLWQTTSHWNVVNTTVNWLHWYSSRSTAVLRKVRYSFPCARHEAYGGMKIWLHAIWTPDLMGVNGHIYTVATIAPGKFPGCQLYRRLGRSHGRSGRCAEERDISCPCRESNHDFSVSHPAARPCYAGETTNHWKTALCLNLRLVRDVIVRFRRVYRLCLKTVPFDVWERACYLLFSCLLLWRGGVVMNWSTRAEWETRGRPCSFCCAHLTVDVAGRNFRSLLRTCSWRSSPANVLEVSYLKCSTRCCYVPFNFSVGIVLDILNVVHYVASSQRVPASNWRIFSLLICGRASHPKPAVSEHVAHATYLAKDWWSW